MHKRCKWKSKKLKPFDVKSSRCKHQSFIMARVHEDSSNVDDDIGWISDASDYVSNEETLSLPDTLSLPTVNSPIILEVIKSSTERNFYGNALDV